MECTLHPNIFFIFIFLRLLMNEKKIVEKDEKKKLNPKDDELVWSVECAFVVQNYSIEDQKCLIIFFMHHKCG